MNLRIYTAPAADPVPLEIVRQHLRIDGTHEDALLARYVKAATEEAQNIARRALITQTWEQILDRCELLTVTRIRRPPLQSVESVQYFDEQNAPHTWTDYVVDTRSEPGTIIFNTMPTSLQKSGAVVIRFVAGYGDPADVPEKFKTLILALVAFWYETRESTVVPKEIKSAFMSERVVWF